MPHPSRAVGERVGNLTSYPDLSNDVTYPSILLFTIATAKKPHAQFSPRFFPAISTIAFPIISEAVAAGEGTFSTCKIFPEGTN